MVNIKAPLRSTLSAQVLLYAGYTISIALISYFVHTGHLDVQHKRHSSCSKLPANRALYVSEMLRVQCLLGLTLLGERHGFKLTSTTVARLSLNNSVWFQPITRDKESLPTVANLSVAPRSIESLFVPAVISLRDSWKPSRRQTVPKSTQTETFDFLLPECQRDASHASRGGTALRNN